MAAARCGENNATCRRNQYMGLDDFRIRCRNMPHRAEPRVNAVLLPMSVP